MRFAGFFSDDVCRKEAGTMGGQRRTVESGGGFCVLQLLVVAAVVAVVAGIALPVCASRAKDAVLSENMRTLETAVKYQLALDADAEAVAGLEAAEAPGADGPWASLVAALQRDHRPGHGFVNPLSGSTAIVCQSGPTSATGLARPAVWITGDDETALEALRDAGRHQDLAGTLVVLFHHEGGSDAVDIFFVDRDGRRSADVATVTT
jgi:type II secretory pathway pseudopilin PulG